MPAQATEPVGALRRWIALSLACAFAIFAFAAAVGLTGSRLAAVVVAAGVAALVAWAFWRRSIVPLVEEKGARAFKIVAGLVTIAALFQLLRLCVFIVNPAQAGYAIGPSRGLGLVIDHSCLSSYYVAARSISTTPNVYANELYSLPDQSATAPRRPRRIASFDIDVYEYPPPFLLIPRALMIVAPDFLRFRMIWFALNGAVMLIGVIAVARTLGPVAGTRALLLSPLVMASSLTLNTLQIGNLQAMVFSIAMIAMVLLNQRRRGVAESTVAGAAGGALLAYVTVSKLFPGMLLVYLLVQRRWRALAWTTGLMTVLVAISLLDTGWAPYRAFLAHLPRLLSGESFPAFRNAYAIAKNYSVPGMAFKLHLFGVSGASFGAMKVVGWIYTLVVLAATVLAARRRWSREQEPLVWLAILILASLRSPFLPGYAVIPVLWLLTLLAATVAPTVRTLWLVSLAWMCLNVGASQSIKDPRLLAATILLPQAVIVILLLLTFRSRPDRTGRLPAEVGSATLAAD